MTHIVALVDDDRNIITSVSMALEGEGLTVRFSVTASTEEIGAGRDPMIGGSGFELTRLAFSADAPLSASDRQTVGAYVAVLGHSLAGFLLNDATPALPVASINAPAALPLNGESIPTGLISDLSLTVASPSFRFAGDHLEAEGAFGALP